MPLDQRPANLAGYEQLRLLTIYSTIMTHCEREPRPIGPEFGGDIEAWATTLGMPVAEFAASIDELIERGHLEKISHGTYRMVLRPAIKPTSLNASRSTKHTTLTSR
jgi:hypothetical protein